MFVFGVLDETHLRQQKTTIIIEHYIYSSSDTRRCFCISSRACAQQDPVLLHSLKGGQLTRSAHSGPILVVVCAGVNCNCRRTPNWSVNRVILFQFWPLPTPQQLDAAWQLFYCILRGTICVSMERAASKVPVVRTKEGRKEGRKKGRREVRVEARKRSERRRAMNFEGAKS